MGKWKKYQMIYNYNHYLFFIIFSSSKRPSMETIVKKHYLKIESFLLTFILKIYSSLMIHMKDFINLNLGFVVL